MKLSSILPIPELIGCLIASLLLLAFMPTSNAQTKPSTPPVTASTAATAAAPEEVSLTPEQATAVEQTETTLVEAQKTEAREIAEAKAAQSDRASKEGERTSVILYQLAKLKLDPDLYYLDVKRDAKGNPVPGADGKLQRIYRRRPPEKGAN